MRTKLYGFLIVTGALAAGVLAPGGGAAGKPAKPALTIVDKPIDYGDQRQALTISYRRQHYGADRDSVVIEPRMVVLHWTDTPTMKSTWNGMNRIEASGSRKKLKAAGDLNVSAQFLVDRDGTAYRLMPENWMARHTIGLNETAIGIENVGSAERPLTDAQVKANAELVRMLAKKFPITHVIGHSEYRAMEGHPYFREQDPKYRNEKPDPGARFLKKVRALIADLNLAGPPAKKAAAASETPAAVVTRVRIVSAIGAARPDDAPKRARADQPVTLFAVVEAGGKLYADAPEVKLAGRVRDAAPLAELGPIALEWRKVEPASDNVSNTGTGQFHYQTIAYDAVAMSGWNNLAAVRADVRPTLTPDRGHGLGTMRYQLAVTDGTGRTTTSPGPDARRGRGSGGLADDVHRVSLRRDDSFLGYLTEMFGQPYIWASAGGSDRTHQSERLEGSDCADLMTYGRRRAGFSVAYTWTEGLKTQTRRLAAGVPNPDGVYLAADGRPIKFTQPGDLVLFPRHVGALVEDRGVPGVLDAGDIIMHTLFKSPAEEAIADSGYAGNPIELLRWK